MKTLIAAALAATSLCALPSLASAQDVPESGFYGNVFVGSANVDDGTDEVNLIVAGARVGYEFNRYIAVEGEGALGVDGDTITGPPDVDVDLEHAFAGYVVGQLPINDRVSLFARVGYGTQEISASLGGVSVDLGDESVNFGGGARVFFTPRDGVQLDYTHHDFQDGGDAGVFSIGYVRRFR